MLDINVVLHIGVHKSGTTWLQEAFFSKHPDLNLVNNYNEPWKDNLIKYLIKKDNQFSPERAREILVNAIEKHNSQTARKTIVISSGAKDAVQKAIKIGNHRLKTTANLEHINE